MCEHQEHTHVMTLLVLKNFKFVKANETLDKPFLYINLVQRDD